jgi:hypothetical protein
MGWGCLGEGQFVGPRVSLKGVDRFRIIQVMIIARFVLLLGETGTCWLHKGCM